MRLKLTNPVLTSELKVRMRGWKTAAGLIAYLGIMVLIAYLYYLTFVERMLVYSSSLNARQEAGIQIYSVLVVVQFSLILLITPAQTAGTISSEREKQTLDLILCTRLSPFSIIVGKLLSSMSFMLLLIFVSIPLFSMIFLFGGISPWDIAILYLFFLITAFAVGSIGIFCSTLFKRTVGATVATYLCIFVLGIISVILGVYMASNYYTRPGHHGYYVPFVLYINPAVGLADILASQLTGQRAGFMSIFGLSSGYQGSATISFWIKNSVVMLVIAFGLLGAAMQRLNPIKRHKRKKQVSVD